RGAIAPTSPASRRAARPRPSRAASPRSSARWRTRRRSRKSDRSRPGRAELRVRLFRFLLPLVTGVAGDRPGAGEELLIDLPRHLEHAARGDLAGIILAREIAADVTEAARHAERDGDLLHLPFEFRGGQAFEDLDVWRVDDLRRGRLGNILRP